MTLLRARRRLRSAGIATLLLLLGAGGCDGPVSTGLQPVSVDIVQRLVDAGSRAGAQLSPPSGLRHDTRRFPTQTSPTSRLPTATIADDTRTVLAGHARAVIAFLHRLRSSQAGVIELDLKLGDALTGARRALVVVSVRASSSKTWLTLAPMAAAIREGKTEDSPRTLSLVVKPTPALANADYVVNAIAYHLPETSQSSYATPEIQVPRKARLEFSPGVLLAEASERAVRFSIEACAQGDCREIYSEDFSGDALAHWNERTASLGDYAGQQISLRFRTTAMGEVARSEGRPPLTVWGNPTVLASAPSREAPSFVLISIDTLRADHLDSYGYERSTAPHLDQLAKRGVVFEQLIAEATTTDPSHMTLFTSLPSVVHGVQCCLKGLATPVTTLAETLRGAGFATGAFTENGPLAHDRGFSIGFDSYLESKSADLTEPSGQVDRTFALARDWLRDHADRSFFLFLHTFQVHSPYTPPNAYRHYFASGSPADKRSRLVANYDREIRYVDDELRDLVAWMREEGLLDRTVLIVTSDHGEEFYEHGSLGHATLPYEEVLRVPLIMVGPGIAAGRRVSTSIHHLDLMPTLLDLAQVALPPGLMGRSMQGLLRDPPSQAPADIPLYSVSWQLPDGLEPPALAVRSRGAKLIRVLQEGRVRRELYDLASDPRERVDRIRDDAQTTSSLAALLDAHTAALSRHRPPVAEQHAPVHLDPERENKLRALGYID